MIRSFAVVSLSVVAVLAAPVPDKDVKDIPDLFNVLIPQSLLDFVKALSAEDKATLKEVAKDYKSFKNNREAIAALKAKSATLGAKAVELYKAIAEKLDVLGTEARAFAIAFIKEGTGIQAVY